MSELRAMVVNGPSMLPILSPGDVIFVKRAKEYILGNIWYTNMRTIFYLFIGC